jgi:4-carboxymuconolactone decarboxylase
VTRLETLSRDQLESSGQSVWDLLTSTRGPNAVTQTGAMAGPFNAWLYVPDIGTHLAKLGKVLRFEGSIDRRLLELAIITTAAHWKAEFEWWTHSRMARESGFADAAIQAIGRGESFEFENDDERVVHAMAHQLAESGHVDHSIYQEAQRLFGDKRMVEIVSLCGYYTLVSFTLNAFSVPLPPGIDPQWA